MSDLRSRQVAADFPSILTKLNHLSMQRMDASLQVHHGLANRSRRKICLQKRANDCRISGGLLRHADAQGAEELRHGLVCLACHLDGCFQFAELHFSERQKDVVLAWEIIKKCAFAYISSLGDVLDGGFQESFLGEKFERGAEKALADLRAAALPAIRSRLFSRSSDG